MDPRFKGRSVSDATWDRLRKKAVDSVTGPTTGLSEEQTDTEHQQKEEESEGGEEMEETIPPLYKKKECLGGAVLGGGQEIEVDDPTGYLSPHPQ